MDAAVGRDPAGTGVGMGGVRQDVAVVAGDWPGLSKEARALSQMPQLAPQIGQPVNP